MSFLSIKFLILIAILLILMKFIRKDPLVRLLLIAAGYTFYAFFDVKSLVILIALSLFTWFGGRVIDKKRDSSSAKSSKALCFLFVAIEILVLCFFKYAGFFPMPVGMSFYMLQAVGFLIDSYRGDLGDYPSLTDALLYMSFFPVIVSGPIQKAKDFIPKIAERKALNSERFSRGIQLFVIGAFLKLVMADRLAVCVDAVYLTPLVYSGLTLFITSVGYTLQLLFDFAGYSDMAIGVAYLLGFDLDKNFNLPYLAADPSEFWRRWHISLSTWLREYVYIPLGGNRKGKVRTYLNIFLTMIISGLWHGSTVNFLIWGGLHGLWQVIHRMLSAVTSSAGSPSAGGTNDKKEQKDKSPLSFVKHYISMIVTFLIVNFLWIPFRAATLKDSWTIFTRIVTLKEGAGYYYTYIFIFGIILLIVQFIAGRFTGRDNPLKPLPLDKMYGRVIFCCLVISIFMFAYFGNGAFIYSQF
ncbi:MAG: hypothetical protein K5857_07895 [Lachnospiraceae bacterium]|nr:hypothetical protein [Lachnospiraceae bacterium]